MTVTLGKLVTSIEALRALSSVKVGKNGMPTVAYFRVKTFLEKVEEHVKRFEEARVKLVKSYGEEKEDGTFVVKPDQIQLFNAEYKTLVEEEVEVPVLKLTFKQLETGELSISDLRQLEELLTIEKE